jgi:hypothetical protein
VASRASILLSLSVPARVPPAYVSSASNPVVANVGFRSIGCQELAASTRRDDRNRARRQRQKPTRYRHPIGSEVVIQEQRSQVEARLLATVWLATWKPFVLLCWAAARSADTGSADGGWPDTDADAAKRILFLMMMKGEGSCNGGNLSYS